MPQSCSMKNGKYTKYSRIFHTFAWSKISRRISLPHYAVLPYIPVPYLAPGFYITCLSFFLSNRSFLLLKKPSGAQSFLLSMKRSETIGCLRRVTFLSPNKKVTKEVGLGGGTECRTPDAKAVLPLRTPSRRAFSAVRLLSQLVFLLHLELSG